MVVGTIVCKPGKASLYRDTEFWGKMDPLFVLTLGNKQVHRSFVCDDASTEPDFTGTVFEIPLDTEEDPTCSFTIQDDEDIKDDDIIGSQTVNLAEIAQQGVFENTYDIFYEGNKTGIVFIQFEFFAQKAGKLVIYPQWGNFPEDIDIMGNMDPLCEMKTGEETFKTMQDIDAGKNPNWAIQENCTRFEITMTETSDSSLRLRIMDVDVGEDEFIGSNFYALSLVQQEKSCEKNIVIYSNYAEGKKFGEVCFKFEFFPAVLDTLSSEEPGLMNGQFIQSFNGRYKAMQKEDGNFAILEGGNEIWTTGMQPIQGQFTTKIQSNGNIVVFDGENVHWCSNQMGNGEGVYRLQLQNSRSLVMLNQQDEISWSSNTEI